jgi:mitochondrial fission protein ELM1
MEGAPEGCWTILIGGSSRTHRYAAEDWSALARGINELARRYGIRWLLSTSRRTGVEAERQLAREIDGGVIAEAVWYGREPKKSVGAFLAAADRIFVTQDSLTMMSEGLAMDKRVELLVPRRWELPESGFSCRYVRRLIAEGHVGRTSMENFATHRSEGDGKTPVSATRERWAESFVAWASGKGGLL